MKKTLQIILITTAGLALASCGGGKAGSPASKDSASTATAAADTTADLSGPPTINALVGSRNPRKCAPVKHVPNATEAAALIQCSQENGTDQFITLYQNVQVEMADSRPYQYDSDSHNGSIDTTSPVYPIRVTADHYGCGRENSCTVQHSSQAPGSCFKTTFGDWNCYYSVTDNVDPGQTQGAPPTTY